MKDEIFTYPKYFVNIQRRLSKKFLVIKSKVNNDNREELDKELDELFANLGTDWKRNHLDTPIYIHTLLLDCLNGSFLERIKNWTITTTIYKKLYSSYICSNFENVSK